MTKEEMKQKTFTYDELREKVVSALRDRAKYLGQMYRALPKDEFDQIAREALFEHGYTKTPRIPGKRSKPSTLGDWLVDSTVIANSCEFNEYIVNTDEECVVRFNGPCSLVMGWKEMGFSQDEIQYLCDVACSGDRGMAEGLGLKVHFNYTGADGVHEGCEIVIRKK